jgi:hypothetical protein
MHSEVGNRFWVDSRFGQMHVSPVKQKNPIGDVGKVHKHGDVFSYGDWTLNHRPSESYMFYKIISPHETRGWACINAYAMLS